MEHIDNRTFADLAKEVLQVQDACNLSGVVHSWSRSISRLRALLDAQKAGGTDAINGHFINVLWADKCASLAGCQDIGTERYRLAYAAAKVLAG